jgi:hypothetical protein
MADVESTQNAPANIELIAPEIPIPPSGSDPVRYLTIGRGDPGAAGAQKVRLRGCAPCAVAPNPGSMA